MDAIASYGWIFVVASLVSNVNHSALAGKRIFYPDGI
jgi:hypothetical protein